MATGIVTTRRVVWMAIVAALYAVLTIGLAPLSYGPLQFRASEALKVFVLFDPFIAFGIGMGTFMANLASPYVGPGELIWMPLTDIVGGLIAFVLFRFICRGRYPVLALMVYAVTTGLAVATMLAVLGLGGFWFLAGTVGASEVIILLGGLPLLWPIGQRWLK